MTIRHCVLLRFKADVPKPRRARMLAGFEGLASEIDGIVAVASGPNVSPEGLDRGLLHGFTIDFQDAAARDAYLVHPAHVSLAGELVAALEGGVDGVTVFDLEL